MTRREDPIWGTPTEADLGNEDSMHLTNAVPQIQPFNAGIWNGLEDYALDHARDDSMRISVMTGPIMTDEDRTLFGVQVPTDFWKVIAFIHDETGELCATGYTMSQRTFLDPEEFVYGEYETSQVPIRLIESRAGLTFGSLSRRDPLAGAHPEAATMPLSDFNEIQFVPDE
jgi:endonuclease G